MKNNQLNVTEMLDLVMPTTPDVLRKTLINAGIVETHKAAQEKYVAPYLAALTMNQATDVESVA